MSLILTELKNRYVETRGFNTDRRLVVIESDDWGSIRMPSRQVFHKLRAEGDRPEADAFLSNDCLESEKELADLLEVLSSVRDSKGRPAVITANFAMANPDFESIGGEYSFEPFYKTYDRYYPENKNLSLIKEGIENRVFFPQLHCREHLSVNRWMADLNSGKADTVTAFNNRMIGIGASFEKGNPFGYMDAFNSAYTTDEELGRSIKDACCIFEDTFGFSSKSFVASCFVWSDGLEEILKANGINGIQCGYWQLIPKGKGKYRRRLHYTGERSSQGQIYTVRNCEYEPAYLQNAQECAERCFGEVQRAFRNNKPAIISSHRFNYIGSIEPQNARSGLMGLKQLLEGIASSYEDVEFITSAELLEIITENKNL